jgi:SAM-dependent methyltransferase
VLAAGSEAARLASSLAPWVSEVHGPGTALPESHVDWAFVSDLHAEHDPLPRALQRCFGALRPGGHLAVTVENRWGLHWIADWRPARGPGASTPAATARHGLSWHLALLRQAGADRLCAYALLPSRDAPRAIVPVLPPCPPAAQTMALDQVWQRATPPAALLRRGLGVLVHAGLMRHLYPHYLVVGRKPC